MSPSVCERERASVVAWVVSEIQSCVARQLDVESRLRRVLEDWIAGEGRGGIVQCIILLSTSGRTGKLASSLTAAN